MVATSKRTVNTALIRRWPHGTWIAAALLLVAGSVARADSTWVDRYRAAQAAYRAGDLPGFRAGLLRVAAEIGETPGVNYNLACAEARLGRRDEAIRRLRLYAASGLVSDAAADSDLISLWSDPAFRAIAARIRSNGDSIGTASEIHRFRNSGLLTEDLAYDPKTRSFFATSVHHGRVVEVSSSGAEREWVDPEARPGWGVFGACVDAPRRLLWTSIGAVPTASGYDPADSGRTGLVAWDLKTRKPIRHVEWPRDGRARLLGDLTVGADGTVYACDSPSGAVRMVRPGAKTLTTLVPDGGFRGPQTPALARDTHRLYVPDYGRGIAIVDLASGKRTWLTFEPGLALQGIDGLYTYGNDLIAVQNGVTPRRVTRFRLDRAGTRVLGASVIESGTHRLGEPTHGVVVGDEFMFLANTGWERVGRDQILREGAAEAPAIFAASLRPGNARSKVSALPRRLGEIHFSGEAVRGGRFEKKLPNGIRFVLLPYPDEGGGGWRIGMFGEDSNQNLVGIATPPYHGMNESVIEAWHFRNADNSGPNTGEVNAPQKERGFYFLQNPNDYPAYADAVDRALHAPADSSDTVLDRTPVGEGLLVIREMKLGGLGAGSTPYFESIRFDVDLNLGIAAAR